MTPTTALTDQTAQVAQQIQEPVKAMAQQMLQWAQSAGQFAQEQAPLIAQEIVAREIAADVIRIGFFLAVIVAAVYAAKVMLYYASTHQMGSYQESDWTVGAWIIGGVGLTVGTVGVLYNVFLLLSAYFAPRLLVIEYLSDLLK